MPQHILDPRRTDQARNVSPNDRIPGQLPRDVRRFGFVPDCSHWLPGDLLLFSAISKNLAQRAIVTAQTNLLYDPDDSEWHHVAVYIGKRRICEALPRGVRYHPIDDLVLRNRIRLRRRCGLTSDERYLIAIHALMLLPQSYDFFSAFRSWVRSRRNELERAFTHENHASRDAVTCGRLFHDAYTAATEHVLVPRADSEIVPAELSNAGGLKDIPINWVRLPGSDTPSTNYPNNSYGSSEPLPPTPSS